MRAFIGQHGASGPHWKLMALDGQTTGETAQHGYLKLPIECRINGNNKSMQCLLDQVVYCIELRSCNGCANSKAIYKREWYNANAQDKWMCKALPEWVLWDKPLGQFEPPGKVGKEGLNGLQRLPQAMASSQRRLSMSKAMWPCYVSEGHLCMRGRTE